MDKHIRKLDSDLARFEAEIQDKAISATRNVEEGSQKQSIVTFNYELIIGRPNLSKVGQNLPYVYLFTLI